MVDVSFQNTRHKTCVSILANLLELGSNLSPIDKQKMFLVDNIDLIFKFILD